mmetsp:Transcript_29836/g.62847  ORF Transcript_29836/g.62847 Transcript_29836/m.62847 type:complete len:387 (+) Transcript_29836:562-1722(+)
MSTSVTASDSFASRMKDAMRGEFKPFMKRSFLILALFEAKRCLAPRLSQMRPFQRMIAIMTTAMDLIYTLDFLSEEQKAGIVSMTARNDARPIIAKMGMGNGREKRIKEDILPGIAELLDEEKTHDEEAAGKSGKCPLQWEFARMPIFLVYRVYYRKLVLDQDIFAPIAPREVDVPSKKPDIPVWKYVVGNWSPKSDASSEASNLDADAEVRGIKGGIFKANLNKADEGKPCVKSNHKKRLERLMELKVRLELLKEIEEQVPKGRVRKEMSLLLSALPPPLAAEEVQNRQAAIIEAQLSMELLKKMKTAIPSKRIVKEMKKLFNGLPPLPGNNNVRGDAQGAKAFVKGLGNKTDDEAELASNNDDGWENLDDMKIVNSAVDGMEIV